ncbi:MAG TPA: polyphosphate kinase 1 [Acidimicrobiales bacterium]|nr:polyphosphate kinase 1 [Acidimicrobiales bacterium]
MIRRFDEESVIPLHPERLEDEKSPDHYGAARFLNRELSWLEFADRLLDLAADASLPLLERVKFLAIFSSGLDEFFQVRVAGLRDQEAAGYAERSADGRTPTEQLAAVRERTCELVVRNAAIFSGALHPALAAAGIRLLDYEHLDAAGQAELDEVFERKIFPVLTPLAVDPGHPFPYISNLSLNLAVRVEDPEAGMHRFARVKVPPLLPRFVPLADGERFCPLEQVIAANLHTLFPEMEIGGHYAFRVTRNADLDFESSDADDLLAAVEIELRRRRFGRAVRLEIDPAMSRDMVQLLLDELELDDDDVYAASVPLDLAQLWSIAAMDRADLKDPPYQPVPPPALTTGVDEPTDFFAVLAERDVLVHHPYESFAASVDAFVLQAAADPDVLAIKQTLYRTAGDAQIVAALARAAEEGKQVAALVELTARFDEQRNIAWARQLEQAGVHVVYGVVGLKTHAKTILVVRREADGIRRYCHVGTGNYNADTARIYEDLGLFTADEAIGADLTDMFNYLTGFSQPPRTRRLVLAPQDFRPWVLEQIALEAAAGEAGRIALKLNGITDPEVIDALYGAARAGCAVSLVVRGLCCLRPGVPGLSETIRVRSIVSHYLEHSRIYRFGSPGPEVTAHCALEPATDTPAEESRPARYFVGSADLIQRNLDFRIEALAPVLDPELCGRLEDVLTLCAEDDHNSWTLSAAGSWRRSHGPAEHAAQRRLQALAHERAQRRRAHEVLGN